MNGFDATRRVGAAAMAAGALLGAGKLVVGLLFSSHGMISDGLNSVGDMFASVMTLIGNSIARKPGDSDHPWGHGKAEFVYSAVIALSMLVVAWTAFSASLNSLRGQAQQMTFSVFLPAVALVTIAAKSVLFVHARRIHRATGNLLVEATAMDHRNDLFLSGGTLIGIVGGALGAPWLDGVIGMIIAVWIALAGLRILRPAYRVLMDTAPAPAMMDAIHEAISRTPGVDHIDDVRVKPLGDRLLVTVKLSVDGEMTVRESHQIAGHVKAHLLELREVQDVVVHVNPV